MNAYSGHWQPASSAASAPIHAELSTESGLAPPSRKSRRAERVTVEIGAGLRQRGASGVSVQIMDLSTDGFRVATHLDLPPGTDVWLRLPGLEPCHSRVVWAEGHFVGCAFMRPLHPAVVEMVVGKAGRR
jgi:PilZ domain